ncbi:MAG: dihydroxyacetone kinase subunit DhaL [Anaerolineales bacterium]
MTISRDAVIEWIKAYAAVIETNKNYLVQLDSDIGDGDHGANMHRGMQAVVTKLPTVADKDIGTMLKTVGMTLVSTVGGASGPLYGTMFMQMGTAATGKMELTLADWAAMLEAGLNGVIMRGKANPGDKTMVDALAPALIALKESAANGAALVEALRQSAAAAEHGTRDTIPLVAKKGRASYLGERSAGHQDPGATSSTLLLQTAVEVWGK